MAVTIFLITFSGESRVSRLKTKKSTELWAENDIKRQTKTRVRTESECYRLSISFPFNQSSFSSELL